MSTLFKIFPLNLSKAIKYKNDIFIKIYIQNQAYQCKMSLHQKPKGDLYKRPTILSYQTDATDVLTKTLPKPDFLKDRNVL